MGGCSVQGELTLLGNARPVAFDLTVGADGHARGQRRRQADRLGHDAVLGPVRQR